MRRRSLTFASEIKSIGNSYYIGIRKADVAKMGLSIGDDIDVTIRLPEMMDEIDLEQGIQANRDQEK